MFKNMGLNKSMMLSEHFKLIFIIVGVAIIIASTLFSNKLARSLSEEEQKKIELWAEATRQFVLADENSDIEFYLDIIEGNNTIPVVVVDESGIKVHARNIDEPEKNVDEFYAQKIASLKLKHEAIVVDLGTTKQYIYYDDSLLLKQLYYYPYIQLGVIVIFLLISFFAFSSTKNAEQNKVWVGLSKETAHQLGTPISSLLAWVEMLKLRYADDTLIVEMSKDVNRLRVIAERFSKIGSLPDLQIVSLTETLSNAVQYISKRSSQKVKIQTFFQNETDVFVRVNVPLFEWVIENLCKNAIDAMDGVGCIDIRVAYTQTIVMIDIQDTGKGIDRRKYKTVFTPGFTTKRRGWGLGLSLAKRIVESYHNGKIFVKHSEINKGTTFRIELKIN